MDIHPCIKTAPPIKLVGRSAKMSILNNSTPQLWQRFMKDRTLIQDARPGILYSVQVYDAALDFDKFSETTEFFKMAAAEVSAIGNIPEGMESFSIPEGLYAVFLYKGLPENYSDTFRYLLYNWLPKSEYVLDTRPHFEILGDKYKNGDPSYEEEVWVPVRKKPLQFVTFEV